MATLYTFNGQQINLVEINNIHPVVTKIVSNKTNYYFPITLSGEEFVSEDYTSLTDVTVARNALITATNSALLDGGGGGSTTFFELTDTPSDYTGHKQKYVKVNEAEDGLEFVNGSGGAIAFGDVSGDPYDNTNLTAALNDKEDVSNKQDDLTPSDSGERKYPTVEAVNDGLNTKQNQLSIRTEADRFALSVTDKDKYIRYTGAGNITVTISDILSTNDVVTIRQASTGTITLDNDIGITLNGELKSAGIHSTLQIIKIDDGEYDVIGGVSY